MSRTIAYRPDIDGLRALAVLLVIAFHTDLGWVPGGFIGVDVFFVISGFLIASIVDRQIAAGTFSLVGFWTARARRLLPALLVVLAATMAVGWFVLMPPAYERAAEGAIAGLFFFANFHHESSGDYFELSATLKPLIHLWTLAVEEQFYLVFPLVFVAIAGWSRARIVAVPAVLGVASFVAANVVHLFEPGMVFYLTPFRIWEFTFGILLALTSWRLRHRAWPWIGLALIVGAAFALDEHRSSATFWGLAPVGGAAIVIASGGVPGWPTRLLSSRVAVALGLMSYSLYLWHQPVFALARHWTDEAPTASQYAFLTLVVFALSWATWRFVETPMRNRSLVPSRAFAGAMIGTATASLAVFAYVAQDGARARLSGPALAALGPVGHGWWDRRECLEACITGDPDGERVLLWGDSHARAIGTTFARRLAADGGQLEEWSMPACPPLPGSISENHKRGCAEQNRRVLARLEAPDVPRTIVLAGRWQEHEKTSGPGIALPDALRSVLEHLGRAGHHVVLVGPTPEYHFSVPGRVAFRLHHARSADRPVGMPVERAVAQAGTTVERVAAQFDHVTVVSPREGLCDGARCYAERDGVPLYRDDDHLSEEGALGVVDAIRRATARPIARSS